MALSPHLLPPWAALGEPPALGTWDDKGRKKQRLLLKKPENALWDAWETQHRLGMQVRSGCMGKSVLPRCGCQLPSHGCWGGKAHRDLVLQGWRSSLKSAKSNKYMDRLEGGDTSCFQVEELGRSAWNQESHAQVLGSQSQNLPGNLWQSSDFSLTLGLPGNTVPSSLAWTVSQIFLKG